MAGSLNHAELIGHVGNDPEIRRTQNGSYVANFNLATSESWKDRTTGEKKEATEWHRIVIFGPYGGESKGLVDVVERYVKKGSKLYLRGPLRTRKWQDQSGQDRWTTEIHIQGFASELILLDRAERGPPAEDEPGRDRASSGAASGYRSDSFQPSGDQGAMRSELDDEIPF